MCVRRGVLVFLAVLGLFQLPLVAQLQGESWERIGGFPVSVAGSKGTVLGVSPGYNSDQTLFVGVPGSGLWRSMDRGQSWVHLSSIPNRATVTAIALDPRHVAGNGYPVYVGTQDGYVYASFDDFATVNAAYAHQFTIVGQGTPVAINCLAVPPAGSWQYFLFVGTAGAGVFYSYTYGYGSAYQAASANSGLNTTYALATSPSGQLLAAGLYSDGGPVFSYGGGTSWTYKGPTGMLNKTPTGLAIAANNTDVFLTVAFRGTWVSRDGGTTWSAGCDGVTSDVSTNIPTAVATCPHYSTDFEVWEGRFNGLFASTDGGVTCAFASPPGWVTAIAFSPGYHMGGLCDAFVGTTAGLYRKQCSQSPEAAPVTSPVPLSPPAVTISALAVAGTGPLGTWADSSAGILRCTRPDPSTGRPFFLDYNTSGAGLGSTSNVVAIRVTPAYTANGTCGTDEATVIVAEKTLGVYKSSDHGNSWAKLDINAQGASTWPSSIMVNDLAISPKYATGSSDETIFAATSGGIYRWDGSSTGWVHVATDWNYSFSKIAVPNTYDRAAGAGFPHQVFYAASDDATHYGLYFSINNGGGLGKFSDSDVTANDITAISFSPGYGLSDYLAFVSRSTSGVFFSADYPTVGAAVFWCPFNTNLSSLNVRDLAASPAFYNTNYVRLLAATDLGPAYCNFLKTNLSYQCVGGWTYTWAASTISPPSTCMDTLCSTFAYLGAGGVAAVGTAEDGVFFSANGGQSFPSNRAGTGYRSLPDDVWTTFPYMRPDIYDPTQSSPVLLASSPTYGVFISRDKGDSFQPYNGPGCTPLNNGAYGLSGGFERYGADLTLAGWTDDLLFAGAACDGVQGGIYARKVLARYGTGIYYPYYLDWYPWFQANASQPVGTFQKIVNMMNGNLYETIWASSATGTCTGLGEWVCPTNTQTEFGAANSGLTSNNASSISFGQTAAPAPSALSIGSPINGSVTQGHWNFYTVVVPNGMTHMNIALFNMSNDADLYVRYAGLPSSSVNGSDYASTYGAYWPDIVNIDASSGTMPLTPGIWYIGVYGYGLGTDNYTIYITDAISLSSTSGVTGTINHGATNHYCIIVPPTGYPHLNMTLTGLSADADLYAKCQLLASNTSWDFYSNYGGTTSENIDITTATSPPIQQPSVEYIGVYGYGSGSINYTLTANNLATLVAPAVPPSPKSAMKPVARSLSHAAVPLWPAISLDGVQASNNPSAKAPAPETNNFLPGPLAPTAGSIWGTVSNTGSGGVFKGTDTGFVAFNTPTPSPDAVTWVARNGAGSTALDLTRDTRTIIQLTGGTLLCGQNGALWQSPAPDEGQTTWRDFTANFPVDTPDVRDFLECSNGDILVAVNGVAGTGGVWLSGCQGRYWMNISSGFDATRQNIENLVRDNPITGNVMYYAGTDSTGAYARAITPSPYPTVAGFSPSTGPVAGGTPVTINGTGFANTCSTGTGTDCPFSQPQVFFGDVMVPGSYLSSTQVTATTPVHGAGSVTVRVMNPDTRWGASSSTFTFTGDTNLVINPVTRISGKVNLYWGVSTEVTVQRATDAQFTQNVVSFSATGDNWTDDSGSGTDGTTYYYRLQ